MDEPRRFDFGTNAWVGDEFLTRRTVELPAPAVPPRAGRWTAPAWETKRVDLAFGAMLAFVVVWLGLWITGTIDLTAALWIGAVGLIVYRNRPTASALAAQKDDLALLEVADDPEVCLVELEIVYDDAPVGTDRGVAWFEDGAMFFHGRRTSFAIGGQDVLPRSYYSEYGRERASALPDDAVPLRALRPRTYVRLTPLLQRGELAKAQTQRLLAGRVEFRERPRLADVPRQWPPFGP